MDQDLIRARMESEFLDTFVSLERQKPHRVVGDRSSETAFHHSLELGREQLEILLQLLGILLRRDDLDVKAGGLAFCERHR